ncbi:RAMP superfamily CRISPR-associated protein [Streptomyces angustmyceticus]
MSIIHLLRADLELTGPASVAAPETVSIGSALLPSLPLARDAWGNPHLPGSALAGSLRAHTHPDRRRALFGDPGQDDGGLSHTRSVASAIRVLGTRMTLPDTGAPRIRHHTAIDPHRAAAAASTLHSRELLPPHTRLAFWLRLDTDVADSPLVPEVVDLLRTWRPRIGGGRTTGLGRAELVEVRHRVIDLTTPEGLRHWLTQGGPGLIDEHAALVHNRSRTTGTPPDEPLLFDPAPQFALTDTLHIGAGRTLERSGKSTDIAQVLRDHAETPLVPGSTWKGVLRSRVAFILRSTGAGTVCGPEAGAISGGCGACEVCRAFGWSGGAGGAGDATGARGLLVFTDSPLADARIRVRHHVPLDRVFGGARDGLLHSEEVVEDGHLTLHIRLTAGHRNGAKPSPVIRACLILALIDLAEGRIGLGRGTTRGNGTLTATEPTAAWLTAQRDAAVHTLRTAVASRGLPGNAAPPAGPGSPEESGHQEVTA